MSRWYDQHRVTRRLRKLERAPCHADDISDLRIDMMDVQPGGCVAAAARARCGENVMPMPRAREHEDFALTREQTDRLVDQRQA